jgi:hypothetical protein
MEYLDDVLVLSGAGVGGGSHVYDNTLYVPPKQFFDAREWESPATSIVLRSRAAFELARSQEEA